MDGKKDAKKQFQQLQTLGEILSLLENLNIDELEAITTGSYLGQAVQLLKNLKDNLNLARYELKEDQDSIRHQLNDSKTTTKSNNEEVQNQNTIEILLNYLKNVVFADTELFADRKSIVDFFKEYFDIDYNLKKESRKEVVSKLCKLLIEKNISREAIGDALLKRTNSKHGSLLKEKETNFLKSWYEAIEKM